MKDRPVYLSQREVNRDINAETWPRSKDRVQTKLDFHCERGGLIRSFLCLEAPAASLKRYENGRRRGERKKETIIRNIRMENEKKKEGRSLLLSILDFLLLLFNRNIFSFFFNFLLYNTTILYFIQLRFQRLQRKCWRN